MSSGLHGHCKVETFNKTTGELIESVEGDNTITHAFMESRFIDFLNHTAASTRFMGLTPTAGNGLGIVISSPTAMGIYLMQTAAGVTPETTEAPYLVSGTDTVHPDVLWYTAGTSPASSETAANQNLVKWADLTKAFEIPNGWRVQMCYQRNNGEGTVRSVIIGGNTRAQVYGTNMPGGYTSPVLSGIDLPAPITKLPEAMLRVTYSYDVTYA